MSRATERYSKHAPITAKCDEWFKTRDTEREKKATEASARLLERCNMLYRRFGRRHGLPFEVARDLQLKGYRR